MPLVKKSLRFAKEGKNCLLYYIILYNLYIYFNIINHYYTNYKYIKYVIIAYFAIFSLKILKINAFGTKFVFKSAPLCLTLQSFILGV